MNKKCLNCEQETQGRFCSNCGQSSHEHRIDAHYFLHDIPHSVFHVDKGFFYTLKCMFTNPGVMIKLFLEGKRVPYFRPFAYVILMTTICSLFIKGIHILEDKFGLISSFTVGNGSFFSKYFSVFIFIMIPLTTLVTWLTFYKYNYNFWEHFLANTYIAAQLNLMLLFINIIGFLAAIFGFNLTDGGIVFSLVLFMTVFLYLYGKVFGYLMKSENKEHLLLIMIRIMIMNFILGFLYFYLMNLLNVISF